MEKKFDDDCNCGSFLSDFINFTFYQKTKMKKKPNQEQLNLELNEKK